MSKYHVIHGVVVAPGDTKVQVPGGPPPDRKEYKVGESFDMDDKDAAPLLASGTIGKGDKGKDDVGPLVTNPLASDEDKKRSAAGAEARNEAANEANEAKPEKPEKPEAAHRPGR